MPDLSFNRYTALWHNRGVYIAAAKQSATKWLVVLTGLAASMGFNAITMIVLARKITVDPTVNQFGQYLASFSLVSFLVLWPKFGLEIWLLTRHKSSETSLIALWMSAVQARIKLIALWVGAMLLIAIVLPGGTFPFLIFVPTILGVGIESFSTLTYASLQVRQQHGRATLWQALSASALLGLVIALPANDNLVYLFAIGRMFISAIFALIILLPIVQEYRRHHLTYTAFRPIIKETRPFLYNEIAGSIYTQADVSIISLFIGSAATGIYGPAINVLRMATLTSRSFFVYIVPGLAKTFEQDRVKFVKKSLLQLLAQIALGLSLSLFIYLFASPIIQLVFSTGYEDSIPILRLISPIPLLRSLNFALAAFLLAGNYQVQRSKVQIVAALFNVIMNILVIVPYGVAGVAVVYVLSESILVVGYIIYALILVKKVRSQPLVEPVLPAITEETSRACGPPP